MTAQRGGIIFRLLGFLAFCAVLGMVYLVRRPLLRETANFWIVADPIQPADVIIVIGDDDFAGDRAREAATLFKNRWAPEVVASGRMLRPYASIADLIARDLESQGVPESAILRFSHRANNTLEEAEDLRGLISQRHWGKVLLVTSNYHTRRARYIFHKVLPGGVSLEVAAAPNSDFAPDSWWQSRQGRKTFFLETMGFLDAIWELRDQQNGSAGNL
ncbi:MAG TPA: YdcF family protein [Terriglobales bacterium]|jgi:uncharacterized SAM-binding protein YcdF (DUF218 family)|nr:YdcF family protein [Terriglobales bacterium]